MEFIKLQDKLTENGINWDLPICCDPTQSSYSLLRIQMYGNILFSQQGVWLGTPEHDAKCRSLLRLANRKYYDLVLFPEYCVSYPLLKKIAEDKDLWPQNRKLWVLPCQGIPTEDFDAFLKLFSSNQTVFLLDTAWIRRSVNKKRFVTALFYCFRAYRGDDPILCLVPQLKTQPMRDESSLCEIPGMSTGSVIFTLNDRLITLLCADSLNNDITWQELQHNGLFMQGLIILHPQLNTHPKDPVFSRLRWELYEHGEPGIYITCNWAKETALLRQEQLQDPVKTIDTSWSCIYRKHADDVFDKWHQKDSLRQANGKYGLFGTLMRARRTEVWFSLYYEQALELHMPNLASRNYGITQLPNICVGIQFCYASDKDDWIEIKEPAKTLRQRINASCSPDSELFQYSESITDPYQFPLDTPEKYNSDQFFVLALAGCQNNILEIDKDENLAAWTHLLDKSALEQATDALAQLLRLIHILENTAELPPQCEPLKEKHKFCYQPAQNGKPSVNFQTEHIEALVGFAQEAMRAKQYMKFLKQTECHNDDNLVRQFIRIFYYDPITQGLNCEPKLTTDITRGESVVIEGDITDGGSESDSRDRGIHRS